MPPAKCAECGPLGGLCRGDLTGAPRHKAPKGPQFEPSERKLHRFKAKPKITQFSMEAIHTPLEFDLGSHICDAIQLQDQIEDAAPPSVTTDDPSIGPIPTSNKRLREPEDEAAEGQVSPERNALGPNHRRHQKRQRRRDALVEERGHQPRQFIREKYVQNTEALKTHMDASSLPVDGGGFTALHKRPYEGGYLEPLDELVKQGYKTIEWDGITCKPLVDSQGRIFACLVGRPNDPTFATSADAVYDAFANHGKDEVYDEKEVDHRRGLFPAVNVGVTLGPGATYPTNLAPKHSKMLDNLLTNKDLKRLVSFADAAFSLWSPRLYHHYHTNMGRLFQQQPHLRHIFPKTVFTSAAINVGPNVWTKKHRDTMNLAFGWCAIQALGRFDPKHGGHLVLPTLKLAIQFPAGSLILIPSATLTHANIPVRPGEARASFTLYSSGGLFRYVANGFHTDSSLKTANPVKYAQMQEGKATRWIEGLELYSKLDDLVTVAEEVE